MKPTSTVDDDEEAFSASNDGKSHHGAPAKTPEVSLPIRRTSYVWNILVFFLVAFTAALVIWFWFGQTDNKTQPMLPIVPDNVDEPTYRIVINGKVETKNVGKEDEPTLNLRTFSEYFNEVTEGEILPVTVDSEDQNYGLIVTVESMDTDQVNVHVVHVLQGGCLYDHVWTVPLVHGRFSLKEANPKTDPTLSCVPTDSSTVFDYHWQIWIKTVDLGTDGSDAPGAAYRVVLLDHVTNLPLWSDADARTTDVLWWKQEENLHWYAMEDLQGIGSTIDLFDTINGVIPSALPKHTATLLDEDPNYVVLQVSVTETDSSDSDDDLPDLCGGWQHVFVVPMQGQYGWTDELVHYCNQFEIQQDVDVAVVA
jgi:hypothetical protein